MTNPPIIPVLIAVAFGRLTGSVVVIDDHPGAFGAQGYRIGELMLPIHRRLAPMARLCLVTDQTWVTQVEEWGGRGLVLHEAPGDWKPSSHRVLPARPHVLFVCTFAPDEPVTEVVEAAAALPDIDFSITGDLAKSPHIETTPNVSFVGFLDRTSYRDAVDSADVIVALTTEPTSAMRAAFEAVWAEKVLVVNDWPLLKGLFPNAVHVDNSAGSIASGVSRSVHQFESLQQLAPASRLLQLDRWDSQIASLRAAISGPPARC